MPSPRFSTLALLSGALLVPFCLAFADDAPAPAPVSAPAPMNLRFDPEVDAAPLQVIGGQMKVESGTLRLELGPGAGWPQLHMEAPQPLDWSGRDLALTVKNAGDFPVEVGVRADDDAAANGWQHSWTGRETLAPGETKRLVLPLGADPMSLGMRGLPPAPGIAGATTLKSEGAAPLNSGHITSWQLFTTAPQKTVSLEVGGVALVPSASLDLAGLVDEFGQWSRADWPGKTRSVADLSARREAEQKALAKFKPAPDLDLYGGWKRGPQLRATGFFRAEKVKGKWWLVDPLGHLFFSTGMDVAQAQNPTVIAGRETLFQAVPASGEPLAQFRGEAQDVLRGPVKSGLTYDFALANLERKYGDDWPKQWNQTTRQRLQSWGFNTLGNWSSDELKQPKSGPRLPYVATSGIYGDHARLSDGEDYWAKMHDPFDPKFASDARLALQEIHAKIGDDPWCLGYFVENELSWGNGQSRQPKAYFGLVYGALNAPATQPAKRAFIGQLRQKYPGIGLLNKAWNTQFKSWDALGAPYQAPDQPNAAMKADFSQFLSILADKYFAVVAAQLHSVAPHHLYLGSRFSGRPPLEVARACAAHCDVVSFNIYAPKLDPKEWAFVAGLNKPALIGEFHIGATDRGNWMPGLVAAPDHLSRAAMLHSYVQSVLDNPNFVGCHWFQLNDQPNTGRPQDGENYGIGFVDITDTPHAEMVAAAKKVNGEIYTRRR